LRSLTGGTFSLFVSVIDIAAPVSYRFGQSASNAAGLPSTVTWSQILAPGLHGIWGFRNTPLCLSFGVQVSPQLRTVKDFNNVSAAKTATRAHAGILFDLPLLNFMYKSPYSW
jgi:hypothetical protein